MSGRWPIWGSVARPNLLNHAPCKRGHDNGCARGCRKLVIQASIANAGKSHRQNEALRPTPRPETRTWTPMPTRGLKGRFQQSQVRQHLVTAPPHTPAPGLKGRFQQSQVREHLERRARPQNHTRPEIGPSGLNRSRRQNINQTIAPRARLVSWVIPRAKAQATGFVPRVRNARATLFCPWRRWCRDERGVIPDVSNRLFTGWLPCRRLDKWIGNR